MPCWRMEIPETREAFRWVYVRFSVLHMDTKAVPTIFWGGFSIVCDVCIVNKYIVNGLTDERTMQLC